MTAMCPKTIKLFTYRNEYIGEFSLQYSCAEAWTPGYKSVRFDGKLYMQRTSGGDCYDEFSEPRVTPLPEGSIQNVTC